MYSYFFEKLQMITLFHILNFVNVANTPLNTSLSDYSRVKKKKKKKKPFSTFAFLPNFVKLNPEENSDIICSLYTDKLQKEVKCTIFFPAWISPYRFISTLK